MLLRACLLLFWVLLLCTPRTLIDSIHRPTLFPSNRFSSNPSLAPQPIKTMGKGKRSPSNTTTSHPSLSSSNRSEGGGAGRPQTHSLALLRELLRAEPGAGQAASTTAMLLEQVCGIAAGLARCSLNRFCHHDSAASFPSFPPTARAAGHRRPRSPSQDAPAPRARLTAPAPRRGAPSGREARAGHPAARPTWHRCALGRFPHTPSPPPDNPTQHPTIPKHNTIHQLKQERRSSRGSWRSCWVPMSPSSSVGPSC